MKFDKFGAFPKSKGVTRPQSQNTDMLNAFLKLLPRLFANTKKEGTNGDKKTENIPSTQPVSRDKIAYREYVLRHDAHVKASKNK